MRWSVNSAITQNYGPPTGLADPGGVTNRATPRQINPHACIIVQRGMYLVFHDYRPFFSIRISHTTRTRSRSEYIYILLPSFLTLGHLLERVKLCTFLARDKSRATRNSDEYSSAFSSRTIERLDWWEFQHARFPLPFSRRTIFTEMRPNWRRPPIIAPPLLLNLRMLNVVVTSAEFAEYPARVG